MVVVKLSMFVLEGCKPPENPNLQRGYKLYVQEKITMHTLSGTEIQKICASMEFEGNQFSTDISVNTVTGEVLQRVCSCKSFDGLVAGRKPTCDETEQCDGTVAGRKPTRDEIEQWRCDDICDHEAAALFKYVNEGLKENSPPESPSESSGSGFWRIGLPIMAGVTAVAAAPLVLTAVGFTSAGIAAGSWAASMMSSAAVANGGSIAAGSLVAVLQSAGAAGIGATGSAVIAGTAAGVTAGGQAIAQKLGESVSQKKP